MSAVGRRTCELASYLPSLMTEGKFWMALMALAFLKLQEKVTVSGRKSLARQPMATRLSSGREFPQETRGKRMGAVAVPEDPSEWDRRERGVRGGLP